MQTTGGASTSAASAGTSNAARHFQLTQDMWPSPSLHQWLFLLFFLHVNKQEFEVPLTEPVSDRMHARCRLSVTAVKRKRRVHTHARNTAHAGHLRRLQRHPVQEASAHVRKITDQFRVYTNGSELAILLTNNTVLSDAQAPPNCGGIHLLAGVAARRIARARHVSTSCNCSHTHTHAVFRAPAQRGSPRSKTVRPLLLRCLRDHTVCQEVDFVCGSFNITVNGPPTGSFVEHRSPA